MSEPIHAAVDPSGPMQPAPALPLRGRPAWWALFAVAVLAVPAAALFAQSRRPELPVLGELPAFRLTDQRGRPFGKDDLRGHAWVANFIYTRCSAACPMLTAKMKRLQDRFASEGLPDARLVSFSVDPERDHVDELAAYADGFGAKDETWRFLTGPLAEVEHTVVRGFKIAMGKVPAPADEQAPRPGEAFEILHGEHMVLVDGRGRIRGYFTADDAGLAALMDGLRRLSNDPRS